MANWTLNGTRIHVQKLNENTKAIIAKLQPLAAGTVYQSFGYQTNQANLGGLIVGVTDFNALHALTESGATSYELISPEGSLGNFFVESVITERVQSVNQTLRPDLDCTAPIWSIEISLLEAV